MQVDRPRFGELAPTTVVALAYVPVSVAAEVKSSLTPSKAGAAAEKAANAADKAAPGEGTTGHEQSSVVTTKFVTAASQDTLNLMELGFEYVSAAITSRCVDVRLISLLLFLVGLLLAFLNAHVVFDDAWLCGFFFFLR